MKDIIIKAKGSKNALISPQTDKAKKIFKECNAEHGMEGNRKHLSRILAWAVSHNLTVESQVPIIIPEKDLMIYEPKHQINLGAGFSKINEEIANADKNLEHLKAIDAKAKEKRQLLYRFFSLNVADGRVFYQITKVTKTKATVTLCDGICLDNYADQILGEESEISLQKAKELVGQRDALEKIFERS